MAEVEDEDSWLYGDSAKEKAEPLVSAVSDKPENTFKQEQNVLDEKVEDEPPAIVINGKDDEADINTTENVSKEELKNEEEEDESDDDVQVTIGEIMTGSTPTVFPQTGLRTFYRNPVQAAPKPTITKGLDMEAPGDINGTPVMETNIDLLDEKPWRKPGADISDYFNYGFNEDTWKQYCDKQKKFRGQLDSTPAINLPLPRPIQNGVSLYSTPPYVPVSKFENTVRSISTLQFSRRKEGELANLNATAASATGTPLNHTQTSAPVALPSVIAQSSTSQVFLPQIRPPVSGTLPSTPLPFPPINPTQPPPGLPIGVPPPGFLISGVPPPGIPPPGVVPPPGYMQSAAVYPPDFQPPIAHAALPPYYNQKDGGDHYGQYVDERQRRPSDSEVDRHSEEDNRYRRERGSSSRRDYDRDRYSRRDHRESRPRERDRDREKERDRDRDKDRERDRDKERDREKDRDRDKDRGHDRESSSSRRYREESPSRHKSSRRKHEDDDRHSSKHKKAKKHKHKDRDSDAPPGTDDAAGSDEPNK